MIKQTLKFNELTVDKKDFYASKQAIPLNSINKNNIIISYRVKIMMTIIKILLVIHRMM